MTTKNSVQEAKAKCASFKAMTYSQLQRPEGRLAYEMTGTSGPLVICVPGMGELRQSYRLLAPLLVEKGCRVVTLDIRGHGDSDATFSSYDDVALASDILALIDELGEPAFLVGNSMAAGAAVLATAEAPTQVTGMALLGPFVRDPRGGALAKLLFRILLTKPWGPAAFLAYYPQWLPDPSPLTTSSTKHRSGRIFAVPATGRRSCRPPGRRTLRPSGDSATSMSPPLL